MQLDGNYIHGKLKNLSNKVGKSVLGLEREKKFILRSYYWRKDNDRIYEF